MTVIMSVGTRCPSVRAINSEVCRLGLVLGWGLDQDHRVRRRHRDDHRACRRRRRDRDEDLDREEVFHHRRRPPVGRDPVRPSVRCL